VSQQQVLSFSFKWLKTIHSSLFCLQDVEIVSRIAWGVVPSPFMLFVMSKLSYVLSRS